MVKDHLDPRPIHRRFADIRDLIQFIQRLVLRSQFDVGAEFDRDQDSLCQAEINTKQKGTFAMIGASALPPKFRHVRLVLAREKGHPEGDREDGYDLLVPLDAESRLDHTDWKTHQSACRVRRFRPGQEDCIGHLRRKPGGQWYFDYAEGDHDDEIGFRLGEERFVTGEYVSIHSDNAMRVFQVAQVEKP